MLKKIKWLTLVTIYSIIRPKLLRKTNQVIDEYSTGWEEYSPLLEACENLEDWLRIKGVEDQPDFYNISGNLVLESFDSNDHNRKIILETIRHEFPNAKSITEFGCGLGRNLLYIKKNFPQAECYGYELCRPGVDIARSAAIKFDLNVSYQQLDYVNAGDSSYVFPETDVAFTLFSLEQLPDTNKKAIENILKRVKLGTVHIEPVPENYPFTLRGIIGRLNHWKANYLRNFERNLTELKNVQIKRKFINTSHSPLMFPTLYIIKKE